MKRILVPCDFSKPSREAFKAAIEIASRSKGIVTVLCVIYTPATYDPALGGDAMIISPTQLSILEEEPKRAFAEMKRELGKTAVKIDFETQVGDVVQCIRQTSEQKKIDLVVMGTTGTSGWAENLIGSNTEKVVRFSEVPVLAIHQALNIGGIKNILLPTTGSLDQTAFIEKIKALQNFMKATLHILLINTPTNFRRDAEGNEVLREFVKHYKFTDYQLHFKSYRTEEEGIVDFANTSEADLIAMATHSRKGFAHLFRGSITEDVVNHIQAPVWTFTIGK